MGNYLCPNIEETFKLNQEFIAELAAIKMERHMHMQNQMREREVAMQIAKERELFYWYGAFYMTSIAIMFSSYRWKRRLSIFTPVVPLTFYMAYQGDLAYGNKLHRIRIEAETILQFEPDLLGLPLGVPTAASIDTSRLQNDEQKKLHPVIPVV